jgi:MSHA pilin protein MshC
MVEIIAVLVLVGILAAIVFRHGNDSGVEAELSGAAEVVKSHLRFAQTKAMNSDVSWGVNFTGASYTLQNASAVTALLPTEVPQGVTFAATVNPLLFDNRWGSPGPAEITVTVSMGGTNRTFTVTANTGFIP